MHEVGRLEHASTEQLSALLDDRTEPEERGFVAGHVEDCLVCSHELADLRSVRGLLRALPVHLPPRSFTIPIEPAHVEPRFRRLIPITRALGALAAVLCVMLFAADAMRFDAQMAASAPAGGAAFQITTSTRTTAPNARSEQAAPAKPAEIARPADAPKPAAAVAAKPAAEPKPAEAAKPAFAPAPTQVPASAAAASAPAAAQAQPAGAAESVPPAAADTTAAARAQNPALAAAPPPPQPQPAPQQPPLQQPAPQQQAPAAPAAARPPQAPASTSGADASSTTASATQESGRTSMAVAASPAAQSQSQAPTTPLVATQTTVPSAPTALTTAPLQSASGIAGDRGDVAPQLAPTPPSPSLWFSPIRLSALAFLVIAGALLIGSLVLSRMSRASERAGARPRR